MRFINVLLTYLLTYSFESAVDFLLVLGLIELR